MKAEIISIGTELLLGEITDLNAAYLAGQLPLLGLDLHFISTVGDNRQRLVETLEQACKRSDIIITTGGLGPTEDDVTREAIADFFQEKISIDQTLVSQFRELFRRFNMDMPESNIKQASIIPSCEVIANPRGTAPGWWTNKNNRVVIAMPGPPGEMQQMWTSVVAPRLQREFCDAIIHSRTLKTFGLSEAKAGEITRTFLQARNPTVGIYAKPDGIHLRITAKAATRNDAEKLVDQTAKEIQEIMGDCVWGTDADSLEGLVARRLIEKEMKLVCIEVDTGGILANMITNLPDSVNFFKYGIVINREDIVVEGGISKEMINQHGIYSQEVAGAVALAARRKYGESISIGLIAVMEPGDPVNSLGTIFIGIADGMHLSTFKRNYPGTRLQIKQRAAISALFELKNFLR